MIAAQFATAGGGKFQFSVEAIGGPGELTKIRKWLSQVRAALAFLSIVSSLSV